MPAKTPPPPPLRLRFLFLLLVLFLVALFLYASMFLLWLERVWQWLLSTFGVGVYPLILFALAFLALRGWRGPLKRGHQWLGALALVLALFGALSFWRGGGLEEFTLGGRLGQAIAGPPFIAGVVRVLLLGYLGFLLLFPRPTLTWSQRGLRGLWWGTKGLAGLPGLVALRLRAWRQAPLPTSPQPPTASVPPTRTSPPPKAEKEKRPALPTPPPPTPVLTSSGWELPSVGILETSAEGVFGPGDVERRAETLQRALADYGVEARVVGWNVGPTVTQFEVEPGWEVKYRELREKDKNGTPRMRREEVSRTRVKIDRITVLSNDLALALAAPSIRIEAPVPGKSIVGIEVPNSSLGVVPLRGVVESQAFQRLKAKSRLALALGKGVGGEAVVADLAKMPHLLIAGATGSGKTVCLNAIICCLVMNNIPEDLGLLLVDPKRVEFPLFNPLPHLRERVFVDREKAVEALEKLNQEMDSRYQKMARAGVRNIEEYRRTPRSEGPMPYIVLVVDELADLMAVSFEEVEKSLCRLAQLARATGIHLVVATQRPSVDVVTGLIKANFPARLSFALASQVDSRTILDTAGAEKLLGRGDMLFLPSDAPRPKRLQGCFVSDEEIERIVAFWAGQRRAPPAAAPPTEAEGEKPPPQDPLLEAARRLAKEHTHLSPSFLQRRLQVGYARAAKLMELLEAEGTVPAQGKEETRKKE